MNLKQSIMYDVTKVVCYHLRISENRLLAGDVSFRVCEARKYIIYLCSVKYKIDDVFILRFFGLKQKRSIDIHVSNVRGILNTLPAGQTAEDIETIIAQLDNPEQIKAA